MRVTRSVVIHVHVEGVKDHLDATDHEVVPGNPVEVAPWNQPILLERLYDLHLAVRHVIRDQIFTDLMSFCQNHLFKWFQRIPLLLPQSTPYET